MEQIRNCALGFKQEMNQDNNLQKNLLLLLLGSRRLLSDHSDIIEEASFDCLKNRRNKKEFLTLLKTSGVVATSYAAFACLQSRYLIPCISSTVPLLYLIKSNNIRKRNKLEDTVQTLIKALDEFEMGVKKTISFINDAQVMDTYAKVLKRYDRKNLIPFHLVDTIKRVIRAIYCFTKYMEFYYKLDAKLSYLYPDIDDIDNCTLMRLYKEEWDLKTIKDFFSLYAYVQSYALLRLGLIVASNIDDSKHLINLKLNDITNKIKVQCERIPTFLDVTTTMKRFHSEILEEGIYEKMRFENNRTVPKELKAISGDALDMSINALSLAIYAHDLHNLLAEFASNHDKSTKNSIDNVFNSLEILGAKGYACSDDIGRLTISFKKYLNNEDEQIPENILADASTPKDELKVVKEGDDIQPQKDDFFYDDPATTNSEDSKHEPKTEDNPDEEELHKQQTKKSFKPVLLQLKQRIVPIGENFKEREKKVLKEKGIEVVDEPVTEKIEENDEGSDDERERKVKQNRNKFNESRELLMSKMQFNVFNQLPPTAAIPIQGKRMGMKEQILE